MVLDSTTKAVETTKVCMSDTDDNSVVIDFRCHQGSDRCELLTETCICHCSLGYDHVHFLSVCHMIVKSNAGFNSQHGRSQLGPCGAESGCLCNVRKITAQKLAIVEP